MYVTVATQVRSLNPTEEWQTNYRGAVLILVFHCCGLFFFSVILCQGNKKIIIKKYSSILESAQISETTFNIIVLTNIPLAHYATIYSLKRWFSFSYTHFTRDKKPTHTHLHLAFDFSMCIIGIRSWFNWPCNRHRYWVASAFVMMNLTGQGKKQKGELVSWQCEKVKDLFTHV